MNSIESLTHEDGNEVANHIDLCDIANVYFNNMYVVSSVDIDPIINSIPSYTLFANNISLIAPFSIEEFKDALFSMFSNQSPGPDGLNPTFYKRFWNLYGLDIFSVATSWLEQDFIPLQENQNSIVLIPKINNPKIMRDYRLASHCNILYKIISKTLASRLKPLLHNVYPMNNLLWLKADPFLIMH